MSTCRPWGPSRAARTCFSRSIIWWRVITSTVSHGAVRRVVEAFANAPVANPDGTTGIQLRVDVGTLYGNEPRTSIPVPEGYGNLGRPWWGRQSDPRGRKHDHRLRQYRHSGDKLLHSQEPRPGAQQHVRCGLFGHQSRTKDDTDPCLGGRAGVLKCESHGDFGRRRRRQSVLGHARWKTSRQPGVTGGIVDARAWPHARVAAWWSR